MSDEEKSVETQVESIKEIYKRVLNADDKKRASIFLELNGIYFPETVFEFTDKLEIGTEFRSLKRIKQVIWLSGIPDLLLEFLLSASFDDVRDGWKQAKELCLLLANISHVSKEAKKNLKIIKPPLNEIILNLARSCPLPSTSAGIIESLSLLCQGKSFICQGVVRSYQGIALMILKSTNSELLVALMQLMRTVATCGKGYVADMCRAYSAKLVDGYDLLLSITAHLKHKKSEVVKETLKTLLVFCDKYPLNLLSLRKNKIDKDIAKLKETNSEHSNICDKLLKMIKDAVERGEELMKGENRVLDPHEAATKIQSAFLGHLNRKIFINKKRAVLKVQRVWRKFVAKKIVERKAVLKQQVEEVQSEFQKHEIRLKEREKKLQVIQSLPANAVSTFIETSKRTAASKIQAFWKGCKQRQKWKSILEEIAKDKAAFKIQHSYKNYIHKRNTPKIRDLEEEIFKFDISKERYQEIKADIEKAKRSWRASMYYENKKWPSRSELYEIHEKAQEANQLVDNIQPHLFACAQHIQKLEKELLHTTEILSEIKSMKDLTPDYYLQTRNRISKEAIENHGKMIEKARTPWWKKKENFQELNFPPLDYYKQKIEENLQQELSRVT